ncbi:hypothetical protein CCR75_006247 [Bremia lactucae]|uniref:Crossover junction endonuclease MUS81 n=1 Tax=Bremia lactucae TaxID=4779 RepID=A0A976IFE5_BRELC|nr:hypothetical protein CCR75_006247 [Bremia lactucae]
MTQRSTQGCVHAANDPLVEDLLALKQRIRESSHLASNYARAIASVRAHSKPLRSVSEAKKLRHIGNYLANQIHGILRKRGFLEEASCAMPTDQLPVAVACAQTEVSTRGALSGTSTRVYVPAYRKQPWFVLLALQEAQAVQEDAAMSSKALLKRLIDTGYDGNSVKMRACLTSLCGTHEVVKRSNMGFYYLTAKGQESAKLCPGSLTETATTTSSTTESVTSFSSTTTTSISAPNLSMIPRSSPSVYVELDDSDQETSCTPDGQHSVNIVTQLRSVREDLIRETDTWELVLLLDHREVIERRNPRILERKLLEQNVNCEVRALGVGDVQWIARRTRINEDTEEFMLNVIVERKEVHDLSGSIIDRRFYEQKIRLATVRESCGDVRVIYLIEGSLTQITTVRSSGLQTAMGRTQMQNNFFVQHCQNTDETVSFLARVYARLLAVFPRHSCSVKPSTSHVLPVHSFDTNAFAQVFCWPPQTFDPFNSQFRKKTQFTVREIYQRMLLQIPGLSAAKTVGLSAQYKNFSELEAALRKRGRDSEVEHVRCGKSQRRLGGKVREALEHLLTSLEYSENT